MSTRGKIKLISTDLDGTFLNDGKAIAPQDLYCLGKLGEKQIVRVAATGRSMHKVYEVISRDVPFDYIVFSSGGGIYDWRKGDLLTFEKFNRLVFESLCRFMLTLDLNFFIYDPIPDNNRFQYHRGGGECNEFDDYLERHAGDYSVFDENKPYPDSGHVMAIIPNNEELFEKLKSGIIESCSGVKVIRTTSPVNGDFIWLEVFPDTVSKGHGLKWIGKMLNISSREMAAVGNDFNDMDMLDFVGYPFVMGNSPDELKKKYRKVAETNQQGGFSSVVRELGLI
ncbi:MAG: HAD family phosphatase [Prolixibacteraceae bacterium]|nr:HAD family phosphatase [Prolixibacteraceae bacterium]